MPAPFLLFLFTLTAAAGYGAWLLRALRIPPGKEVLAWITAAALGLGSTAYLILALGLLGLLRPAALGGIVAGGVLLVVAHLLVERGQPVAGPGAWRSTLPEASGESRERIGSRALGVLLVGAALMSLVGVFRPVESLDWDGLSYHLAAPKIYLREGR
ncbi:MAG: hypothetical protein FJX77_04605, partial [Armatimonadetes bacterium]|nr:hypothetical protein [Armatimonadota bacterium]